MILGTHLLAQDIHFSQFANSPIALNPGLTGQFDGLYRIAGIERRQWTQISKPIPYFTLGLSTDINGIGTMKDLGGAVMVYHDHGGDSRFTTLQTVFNFSYRIYLSSDSAHVLSPGVRLGFSQRSINKTNQTWDNQYTGGQYDPTVPSSENFSNESYLFPNIGMGMVWTWKQDIRKVFQAGIAAFNLTKPNQGFYNQTIKLDRRVNIFGQVQYRINDDFDIIPSGQIQLQGKLNEIDLGAGINYHLSREKFVEQYLYAGLWWRNQDAGYGVVGIQYDEWRAGVSYDVNLSNLKPASRARGGLELSIIYIVAKKAPQRLKYKTCPNYI